MAILDRRQSTARPRTPRNFVESPISSNSESSLSDDSTQPELSSPSTTDSSLSQTPSSHPLQILSLDDPRIRKIWEDPRFDLPVQSYQRSTLEWNDYTFNAATVDIPMEECVLFKNELNPSCVPLNPYAQPFVPSFVLSNLQEPFVTQSPHFFPKSTLPPLEFAENSIPPTLFTIEESNVAYAQATRQYYPPCHLSGCNLLEPSRPLDPPYPPGLPHPPQNRIKQQCIPPSSGEESIADRYSPMLLDALKVEFIPDARNALLCSVIDHIPQWDLFSLRELVARIMIASFGREEELVQPSATGSFEDDHGQDQSETQENSSEEIFCQVVLNLCRQFLGRFGEGFMNAFSFELRESIFARFLFYFDPRNPHSLNIYSKTHGIGPSSSYVRSAIALTKCIANLHRYSLIQSISVEMCIDILLQDLMSSVQHVQALETIVLGTGIALWDPPMSALSKPMAGASDVALPSLVQQTKAKVQSDITAFCSKLDDYRIKCGQNECPSLLKAGESWNAVQFRSKLQEISDVVRRWEVILLELIEEKGAMGRESETQAVVLEGESNINATGH